MVDEHPVDALLRVRNAIYALQREERDLRGTILGALEKDPSGSLAEGRRARAVLGSWVKEDLDREGLARSLMMEPAQLDAFISRREYKVVRLVGLDGTSSPYGEQK